AILGFVVAFLSAPIIVNFFGWDSSILPLIRLYSVSILFHFSGIPTGVLRLYNQFNVFSAQKIIVSLIKLFGVVISYLMNGTILHIVYIYLIADILGNILLIFLSHYVLVKNNVKRWWKQNIVLKNNEFIDFTIWNHLSIMTTI